MSDSRPVVEDAISGAESDDEEPLYMRPPSSVPLDSGFTPSEAVRAQREAQQALELVPTKSQLRSEVAKKIAANEAEKSRERLNRTAYQQARDDKAFKSQIPPTSIPGHANNCRIMNAYRQKFKGKLNFRFRQHYSVELDPAVVEAERAEVEGLMNAHEIPGVIKTLGVQVAAILETLSVAFGGDTYNLVDLGQDVKESLESGYFDDDIEQLAILWNPYFAKSPVERLGYKAGWLVFSRFMKNVAAKQATGPMSEEYLSKTKRGFILHRIVWNDDAQFNFLWNDPTLEPTLEGMYLDEDRCKNCLSRNATRVLETVHLCGQSYDLKLCSTCYDSHADHIDEVTAVIRDKFFPDL